jgi:trk system potassium uptake protein
MYIVGSALLVCVGVAALFHEPVLPFIASALISVVFGIALNLFSYQKNADDVILQKKEAYLTVTLSWIFISILGCLPYLFSGAIPSVVNAFFESISGFTTTGSSILTDIEALSKSILFWRSLTHWIGGLGIIVLVIVIMPSLNMGGYQLFALESSLTEKIQPRIKAVGFRLLLIYVFLTAAEVVLLMLGKMNLFESVCHSFGTIATGGFSPKNDSIAGYSPYIHYVIMIFMFLSATSFVIHYYILKGNFRKVRENEELRLYVILIIVLGFIITFALYFNMHEPFELAFREGFFQLISIISTTGFATADYLKWPGYAWIILFFVMFLGGCTGSTAGGIKIIRHLVLFKNIKREYRKIAAPNAVFSLRLNGLNLSEETNRTFLTFISVYLIFILIGTLLLIIDGVSGETAASAMATTMAGIGPGLSTVGPVSNFAHLNEFSKLVLTFSMLIGRLEIYTVIMLFSPAFWRK